MYHYGDFCQDNDNSFATIYIIIYFALSPLCARHPRRILFIEII
jgi:hypothetical protein